MDTAKAFGVPIRVGVNSGSLEKELIEKYDSTFIPKVKRLDGIED